MSTFQAPSPPITVLFVAGWGRSGSTLLERMLDQMHDVVAVGETWNLWTKGLVRDRLCSCGTPVRSCPFWTEVGSRAFGGLDQIDARAVSRRLHSVARARHVPRLLLTPRRNRSNWPAFDDVASVYVRLYGAIADVSGARVIVDTSKSPQFGFFLRRVPGINVVVLQLVRDSRAVAHSWRRLRRRPDAPGKERFLVQYGPRRSAIAWSIANVLAEVLRARSSGSLLVRYEDMVADPQTTLRRVASAVGLPPPNLDFISGNELTLERGHSGAGNPMRFDDGRVRLALDAEWRDGGVADRRFVTALTAPLLARYGYRLRT